MADLNLILLVSLLQCFSFYICLLVLQLDTVRKKVVEISGRDEQEVMVAACPYRICPLGAHIDHQVTLCYYLVHILSEDKVTIKVHLSLIYPSLAIDINSIVIQATQLHIACSRDHVVSI